MSPKTWRLSDLAAKHAFLRAGLGWGGMPLHLVEADREAAASRSRLPNRMRPLRFPCRRSTGRIRRLAPPDGGWVSIRLNGSQVRRRRRRACLIGEGLRVRANAS